MLAKKGAWTGTVQFVRRLSIAVACSGMLLLMQSCGGVVSEDLAGPSLSPAKSTVAVGASIRFSTPGSVVAGDCAWSSSAPAVLVSVSGGLYRGKAAGNASALAKCKGSNPVMASVLVTALPPAPLVITEGGTYSGVFTSDDPSIPAVTINTDEPVTLRNAVLTGRGDLIHVNGTSGANLTVRNVSGTALDPRIAGRQRGAFLYAQNVSSLRVKHCSMYGVSYGVLVLHSTVSTLSVTKNLARELEDRASDGHGGLQASRPSLGHFVYLYNVMASAGADISWNQVVNTIGGSSTEDVFNIFKSQGSPAALIRVHDNYMEGYSSTTTASYTGTGLIADGDSAEPVTAYLSFTDNEMVHTAGSGVEIAVGHNILAEGNRVVSCGMDSAGHWYAMPFVNAVVFWNYYAAPDFSHNVVTGTTGGMLKQNASGQPVTGDIYARTSDLDVTDTYTENNFGDPCLMDGKVNLSAEDDERAYWVNKLIAHGISPGDRHL